MLVERLGVFADIKRRGFSLLEFIVAMAIVAIVGIALFNSVAYLLSRENKTKIYLHLVDAAKTLRGYPSKINNCVGKTDPCAELLSACNNSLSCANNSVCGDPNTCIVCYSDPSNGEKLYYGFIANNLTTHTYELKLCWIYGAGRGNFTTTIALP